MNHIFCQTQSSKLYISQVDKWNLVWSSGCFWSFKADGVPTFGVREAYPNKNGGQTGSISNKVLRIWLKSDTLAILKKTQQVKYTLNSLCLTV